MDFDRQIVKHGGSLAVVIPVDVVRYLELQEKDGIVIRVEEGKHGKYISMWKKENGVAEIEDIEDNTQSKI